METKKLEEFFAVTVSGSVYRARTLTDHYGIPFVVKVGGSGRLVGGKKIGITIENGLILYDEEKPGRRQRPGEISIKFWGGHTSPIAGLFLYHTSAIIFSRHKDISRWDVRCIKATAETVRIIGDEHDIFILDNDVAKKFLGIKL